MTITSQSRTLHAKVEDEEADRLERLARENDRSVAAEVRRAIRFYLEHQSAPDPED